VSRTGGALVEIRAGLAVGADERGADRCNGLGVANLRACGPWTGSAHRPYPTNEIDTTAATIIVRVRDVFDACSAARLSRIDASSAVHSSHVSRWRSIALASR
jgi:hypothetical protein